MMDELIRGVVLVEIVVLLFCGAYLHWGYRASVPETLWWIGAAYGSVLFLMAVSVSANLLTSERLTPGLVIFASGNVPAVTAVALLTAQVLRSSKATHRARERFSGPPSSST